ncbi:MAG: PEP-CTERM sorting domain-containing protein [Nostoc sp.]|uniref:PEP-CTERM sorting domain-containing protein n=1 Tax=Nostoc sp. TaxID=1180 RepID=UPI002FEF04BD
MYLLRNLCITAFFGTVSLFIIQPAKASLITFDNLASGQTSFGFDGDGDKIDDVIFTTTNPLGFNISGPGLNQVFINEPGLEGTSLLNPDLKVNFLKGAKDFLSFGFALDSFEDSNTFAAFNLFDSNGNSLASTQELGVLGTSDFPEGKIQLNFSGVAAYGTLNFSSDFGRYIIDNFEGNFGSTEVVTSVPESVTILGSGIALVFGGLFHKRKRK